MWTNEHAASPQSPNRWRDPAPSFPPSRPSRRNKTKNPTFAHLARISASPRGGREGAGSQTQAPAFPRRPSPRSKRQEAEGRREAPRGFSFPTARRSQPESSARAREPEAGSRPERGDRGSRGAGFVVAHNRWGLRGLLARSTVAESPTAPGASGGSESPKGALKHYPLTGAMLVRFCNQRVGGSNPLAGSNKTRAYRKR